MRELPEYLRPVPGPGDGSAAAQAADLGAQGEAAETPGLIAPMSRGHTGGFLTDAIVALGYATSEQVEKAIATSRTAGRRPEEMLLEQGVINEEQLSRATAERYGLDYVDLSLFNVDMGATRCCRSRSRTRTPCCSPWPTRPICSPWTTCK
jgi:type IV pilus assembly protein PilB